MNLIEMLKGGISEELIAKIAEMLGVDATMLTRGLDGVLPAIVGGIGAKVQSPDGAAGLQSRIEQGGLPQDAEGMTAALDSPDKLASLKSSGATLVRTLFGEKADRVTEGVSNASGMSPEAASGLMAMSAPLILGMLGKMAGSQGLVGFLASHLASLKGLMPSWVGYLLPGVGSVGAAATGATAAAASMVTSSVSDAKDVATKSATAVPATVATPSAGGGFPIWILPVAALAALASYVTCNKPTDLSAPAVGNAAISQPAEKSTAKPSEAAKPAEPGTDGRLSEKLPDGTELSFKSESVEDNLISFIKDVNRTVDATTWFTFNELEFETAKATLKSSSQAQLENVAKILKAYPAVQLKIGGYTDNTGNKDANMKLSGDRANSTMAALVALGIDPARLKAEGYGDQFPKAPNDTPENMQKNRRIDIRVTAK